MCVCVGGGAHNIEDLDGGGRGAKGGRAYMGRGAAMRIGTEGRGRRVPFYPPLPAHLVARVARLDGSCTPPFPPPSPAHLVRVTRLEGSDGRELVIQVTFCRALGSTGGILHRQSDTSVNVCLGACETQSPIPRSASAPPFCPPPFLTHTNTYLRSSPAHVVRVGLGDIPVGKVGGCKSHTSVTVTSSIFSSLCDICISL